MIVDTSALIAIAIKESERLAFLRLMDAAPIRRISAGSWIELSAVAVRRGLMPLAWLDAAPERLALEIEPVTVEQAKIGQDAYRKYGIGSGHEARLNFGDCFAYALAKATDEPLLFKGNDFSKTDVLRAA